MNVATISLADSAYPAALREHLAALAPDSIFALGPFGLLGTKPLALFCSVKCPGNLILKTYDLARELRDAGVTVISGFHSPMEKECLSILLRGGQPVIWCPAHRLAARSVAKECAAPLAEGRLLVLSPFNEKIKRATQQTALFRNKFVAALAERVFVAYAAAGGKTETFCRQLIEWGKTLLTFDSPETAALRAAGVQPYSGIASIASFY